MESELSSDEMVRVVRAKLSVVRMAFDQAGGDGGRALFERVSKGEVPRIGSIVLKTGVVVGYWKHGAGFDFTVHGSQFLINIVHDWDREREFIWFESWAVSCIFEQVRQRDARVWLNDLFDRGEEHLLRSPNGWLFAFDDI